MRKLIATIISLILAICLRPSAEAASGLFDIPGINPSHGLHGAIPEENVDLFTGGLTLKFRDIHLPGPYGFDLDVWRVYNSKVQPDWVWTLDPPPPPPPPTGGVDWLGLGWSMHMGRLKRDETNPTNYLWLEHPNGLIERAVQNYEGGNLYVTKSCNAIIYEPATNSYRVQFPKTGITWHLDAIRQLNKSMIWQEPWWVVTMITNSHGHKIIIEYDDEKVYLRKITDSLGREVIFEVDNDGHFQMPELERIKVKDAHGNLVQYSYNVGEWSYESAAVNKRGLKRLESFDPPALPAQSFSYWGDDTDAGYELKSYTNSYGGYSTYTYDAVVQYNWTIPYQNIVLWKKALNGSQWVYKYPTYTKIDNKDECDDTVEVLRPDGNKEFVSYYVYWTDDILVPTREETQEYLNNHWKTGLIRSKRICSNVTTCSYPHSGTYYTWQPKALSSLTWEIVSHGLENMTFKEYAPIIEAVRQNTKGDANNKTYYYYETTPAKYWAIPSKIVTDYPDGLTNHKTTTLIEHGYPIHNDSISYYLVPRKVTVLDRYGNTLERTITDWRSDGSISAVRKLMDLDPDNPDARELMWIYDEPEELDDAKKIRITIDHPGKTGREVTEYHYGVPALKKWENGFTIFSKTISPHTSDVLAETNQHGLLMEYVYDSANRVTNVKLDPYSDDPEFNPISLEWFTNSVTITQGNLKVIRFWDDFGRDLGYEEICDYRTFYYRKELNAIGRVMKETKGADWHDKQYRYDYRSDGRLEEIEDPEGYVTQIIHATNDNEKEKTVRDAEGREKIYYYHGITGKHDALKELSDHENTAEFIYDDLGRLVRAAHGGLNGSGESETHQQFRGYDGVGNFSKENHPETWDIWYFYNAEGNLWRRLWNQRFITYDYYPTNQLRSVDDGEEIITYEYDSKGRLSRVAGHSAERSWERRLLEYNKLGSLMVEEYVIPGLPNPEQPDIPMVLRTEYTYDKNNALETIKYPSGRVVKYDNTYLALPRTVYHGISSNPTAFRILDNIQYGPQKQLTYMDVLGNGINFRNEYYRNGRLKSADVTGGPQGTVYHTEYSYNGVGNVKDMTYTVPFQDGFFEYDWHDRLTKATYDAGGGNVNVYEFTYDDFGNVLSATINGSLQAEYSYNDKNQVKDVVYDGHGNVSNNGELLLGWDPRDRLANVAGADGKVTKYWYDDRGLRFAAGDLYNISSQMSFEITSPVAGELVTDICSLYSIRWLGGSPADLIDIEYSDDYGETWTLIAGSTANDGEYEWDIPGGVSSTTCLMRLLRYGEVVALSEMFEIGSSNLGEIEIYQPNCDSKWQIGRQYEATWNMMVNGSPLHGFLKIYLHRNGEELAELAGQVYNDGDRDITVAPDIEGLAAGSGYQVELRNYDENGLTGIYGFSKPFELIPLESNGMITISVPNSDTVWEKGDEYPIRWTSPPDIEGTLRLNLWRNDAQVDTLVNQVTNDGTQDWRFEAWKDYFPDGDYQVELITNQIQEAYNNDYVTGMSDYFTIAATTRLPFGNFDLPANGSDGHAAVVPLEGWALDNVEVLNVKIYRDPVAGEGDEIVYVGDAHFVQGTRPDVEQAYPDYPFNDRAGWSYDLLTNALPGGGNGEYTFHAYAIDAFPNTVHIGSTTFSCDNSTAQKPFGTIDTPAHGEVISGSNFIVWGWALTPQPNTIPKDGHTITVWLDYALIGALNRGPDQSMYDRPRPDVAALFPGYNNSEGAGGYFYLDTTEYSDGRHEISWTVIDDAGNQAGIGSRYFYIDNTNLPGATIAVTSPNGGESWELGTNQTITWSGENLGSTVDIDLWKDGMLVAPIAVGVENSGSYVWKVGECGGCEVSSALGYTIRIVDASSGTSDASDTSFSITAPVVLAEMISPAPGSTLSDSSATFEWSSGTGVERWALWIGSNPGGNDLVNEDSDLELTLTVTGLPKDGSTLYVSLWSMIDGSWGNNVREYTYQALTAVWARMQSPADGSTLTGSTTTFTWDDGVGVERYALWIGSSFNTHDLFDKDSDLELTLTATGLPEDGRTLYVSLWSMVDGVWANNVRRYTYTAQSPVLARMVSPANGSTFNSSTVTFIWDEGFGVDRYALYIGSTLGGKEYFDEDSDGELSLTATNLPQDGSTLFVTLWSMVGGEWGNNFRRYTYTAQSPVLARMLSPANGSTFTSSTVTFKWTEGVGVERYALWVGSSVGGSDIFQEDSDGALQLTVRNIPQDGRALYVSLWSMIGGTWGNNVKRYTYTAQSPELATMQSPANGSTFTSSTVTFKWTEGVGVERYALWVGSSVGGSDIFQEDSDGELQLTVPNLPTDGRTLYVSLWSMVDGSWGNNVKRYTYTAQSPELATIESPANGSTFTSSTVTFRWTAGVAVERYALWVGSSVDGSDFFQEDSYGALQLTVPNLPTDGRTLYVSLWSMINGSWGNNVKRYTYTAASPIKAALLQPANGSTLSGTTVTFVWNAGVGVERYALWIGNSLGLSDIYNQDSNGALQLTVSNLPNDGRTLYVSLWSMIDGSWGSNVRRYTFTASD